MKNIKQLKYKSMKSKMSSAIGLLFLFCSTISFCGGIPVKGIMATGDTVKVVSSPSLMPLVNTWAGKFSELNPAVRVSVSTASESVKPAGKSLFILPEKKVKQSHLVQAGR
jgi:ABC-type phosphate transport system substrate-binding protein